MLGCGTPTDPASGSSIDHAKAMYDIKYVYAPELRRMGSPPEDVTHIEPSFRETWNAIVAMVDNIEFIEQPSLAVL